MPTSKPRYALTDTGPVARTLDEAAERWPELAENRKALLMLVLDLGARGWLKAARPAKARRPRSGDWRLRVACPTSSMSTLCSTTRRGAERAPDRRQERLVASRPAGVHRRMDSPQRCRPSPALRRDGVRGLGQRRSVSDARGDRAGSRRAFARAHGRHDLPIGAGGPSRSDDGRCSSPASAGHPDRSLCPAARPGSCISTATSMCSPSGLGFEAVSLSELAA